MEQNEMIVFDENETSYVVRGIGKYSFGGCSKIVEIILPETLQYIDYLSFKHTKIEKLIIPASVKTLKHSSLGYMNSLKKLVFYKDSKLVRIENNAFYGNVLEEIVFPPSLKEISP